MTFFCVDLNMEGEEPFASREDKEKAKKVNLKLAHMPDQMLAKTSKHIDILLTETDTIWMFELQGKRKTSLFKILP